MVEIRERALELGVSQIEKQFGKGAIMRYGKILKKWRLM